MFAIRAMTLLQRIHLRYRSWSIGTKTLILTLPLIILTLGLFIPVINAFLLKLVSTMIRGFEVHGFWSAVFGALLLSIVSGVLSFFINEHGRVEVAVSRKRLP